MSVDLDETSFENLVRFYSEELIRIKKGERATSVFSSNVRGKLRDVGILTYSNMEWSLAEEVEKLLQERDGEESQT